MVCQDARLSFVNPGDVTPGGTMDDPCAQFDCGANGECLAVNMTPTCVCDRGFVAVGSFGTAGARGTRCEQPMMAVPVEFYGQRLPDLPAELPGGRVMEVDDEAAGDRPAHGGPRLGWHAGAARSSGDADADGGQRRSAGDRGTGAPESVPPPTGASDDDDCAVRAPGSDSSAGWAASLGLVGLALLLRRRRSR